MVADFTIRGADDFARIAKHIKAAGKDARKEFHKALNRSTKPLKDAMKANADILPSKGGLADRVRRARYSTQARGGNNPGVKIVVRDSKGRKVDLDALDRGTVRHPTYGRAPWVEQRVAPNVLTDPFQEGAEQVRDDLITAIEALARQMTE